VLGVAQLVEVWKEERGLFPKFKHDGLPGRLTGVTSPTEHRPGSGPDDPGNVVAQEEQILHVTGGDDGHGAARWGGGHPITVAERLHAWGVFLLNLSRTTVWEEKVLMASVECGETFEVVGRGTDGLRHAGA